MLFFTAVATLLIVYVIYAITKGEVYGLGLINRDDSPRAFWNHVILYGLTGVALLAFV